ncbi:Hormone-sensitive lipase (HSL) N-terminus [Popillia japonica]|uniref:Hormone-sensitive lipase (HSL) N-terminus n=1 Tax=Popillia japonica TaxID=7064 RepID=A0AAW1I9Y9_POPJA
MSELVNGNSKDDLEITHQTLADLCTNNALHFKEDNSENGQRLYTAFLAINDNINKIWPIVLRLRTVVNNYDFDENTPANGYRSFLRIIDSAVQLGIELNKKVCLKRDSVLFRKTLFTKEVESCAHLFASLGTCLSITEIIIENCPDGDLFPSEKMSVDEQLALLGHIDKIDQYCFYGRCLGFQFCESMRAALKFISLSMAIFSEAYYSEGSILSKATNSVMTSTRYFTDPEEKAKRIVNISQNADIDFCKAFWFLSEGELMKHLPSVVAASVGVSKVIHIPTEPLNLLVNEEEIEIPVPTSHIGKKPIQVRLLSWRKREGMLGEGNNKLDPPSRGLLIHCHGGGFVAQSSRSHECYLRQWAKDLDVPILSIDYSLAPQAPYPRALEEVTYAYCWALKNHKLLGSTAERVVAAGDSAGANLLTAMTLKCISLGIKIPTGLLLLYAPTYINFMPSPARLLCVMDPLLPFGFLMRCLKAYTYPDPNRVKNGENHINSDSESFEEITESDLLELQAHKSPISDSSDTLTYGSLSSQPEENKDAKYSIPDLPNNGNNNASTSSQKYVSDFLERYALDSDTDTDLTKVPEGEASEATTANTADSPIQSKISAFVNGLRGKIEGLVPSRPRSGAAAYLDAIRETTLLDELKFQVPRDYYISPFCAPDDMLRKLPPVKLLTVHLDPCLDDCIMFGRKLKRIGHNVTLDVMDGLPHGFLNFSLVSKEAYDGSKKCTEKINELFGLDYLPPLESE